VLITGASQGMGLGVSKLLSSKGANIVIVARDVTKLQAAMKKIAVSLLMRHDKQQSSETSV